MKPVLIFKVRPALPPALEDLRHLAYNLRWAWDHETIDLFRRLDTDLWEASGHNPVRMLGFIEQAKLDAAARDDAFLAHLDRVTRDLQTYTTASATWYARNYRGPDGMLVAYFSAEFGITECLSIFAGGLGILAGDHLKAASDMGVPLVGVGLLYQQGYFRQYLNAAGWQQEAYEDNDFHNLPIRRENGPDGKPLRITVEFPERSVHAAIWCAEVGRARLYLLDTNIPENSPGDRDITDQLYGGDNEMRIRQEIVLGIGGYRALRALGVAPTVYHMNEGHSAFLALEHVRHLSSTLGLTFAQARRAASANLVFTTHTPVPAGHDYFPPDLMQKYFTDYARSLGIGWQDFLALGRQNPIDGSDTFCMTVLALRFAAASNGVSALHGEVTRRMWRKLWPGLPEPEVPIGHVTNGVHFRSWVSHEMNLLYDRYLGPKWREEPADAALWQRIESLPADELWRTHERRRERLVAFARRRLRGQLLHRGAGRAELEAADETLNPEALTIGFARRFASYKRATLLLRDPDRLLRLLTDPQRPVQIIYSGKAHPRDETGKELIRRLVSLARGENCRNRVVFLEDYDMVVARYLVQGCDIWLNTPRRPYEASGTSGMKALANGILNVSTLDGWWDEAWRNAAGSTEPPGWAIGSGEDYASEETQDQVEAEALYDLLEREIVPLFYQRGKDGVPRRWIARMKSSIGTLSPVYNIQRQVKEYTEAFYLKAHARFAAMTADNAARSRAIAAWIERVRSEWQDLSITALEAPGNVLDVNASVSVRARVRLAALTPDDVRLELIAGRLDKQGEMTGTVAFAMLPVTQSGDEWVFESKAPCCPASGLFGFTVRVLPSHPDLCRGCLPGLILWANGSTVGYASA
jgi:starch phosphorylase